jgi:S-DNA-T family DNA segregation ATPase FtsK/SpoIIIE
MYKFVYSALGFAAVLTPIAAGMWGYLKFRSEDKQIPLAKLTGMILLIFAFSAWMHVAFVSKTAQGVFAGGHGGGAGRILGGTVLGALDKIPASIAFFVITLFAFFWTFGISPKILLKPFERKQKDDTDLEDLKEKAKDHEFKLNEGVPVEHHKKGEPVPKLSNFKNTAQKLSAGEDHQALTTASDPNWQFPSISLLNQKQDKADAGDVEGNARTIQQTMEDFSIPVEMEGANIGPRVTQYTLKPPAGVKLTKITALDNNLALSLAAHSIRIEAPIPGKRAVGVEVPNLRSATVRIASILQSNEWSSMRSPLGFVIGRDISGQSIIGALDKMPHLLVAGQTGSGKSVMINSLLVSLLYRNSPAELKLILVDPKQVELTPYNNIPHLLSPVITQPEKCISALKWAVAEMERRLSAFAEVGKRNIAEFNAVKKEESMPYIVIVIDELADLMMMAARDVEALIVRLAQKARAAGIHLVLATQRPSVDVITGLIKANVPARIAFTVASQVDSRTIIDQMGAEKLLGQGDMLLLTSDMMKPKRVQGALIEEKEIAAVTNFLTMQRAPDYNDEIISQPVQIGKGSVVMDIDDHDSGEYQEACRVVVGSGKASTSFLQRKMRIGYSKAARFIEMMEEQGIVGQAEGSRPREVLVTSLDENNSTSSEG